MCKPISSKNWKKLAAEFALDFSSKSAASASLIKFHRNNSSLTLHELSQRADIDIKKLTNFENGKIPTYLEYTILAECLNVNIRDLLPYDKISNNVIVQFHKNTKKWFYPEDTKNYELVDQDILKEWFQLKVQDIALKKSNVVVGHKDLLIIT